MGEAGLVTVSSVRRRPIALVLLLREFGIVFFWLLLVVVLSLTADKFATLTNLAGILTASSVVALLAAGEGLVIMAGSVDLSIAPVAALTGVVTAKLISGGVPTAVAVGIGLLAAAGCGAVNGLVVDRLKVTPLIATLGTLTLFFGIALLITDGRPIFDIDNLEGIGRGRTLGLQHPVFVMLGVYAVVGLVMGQTKFGNRLLATGGNAEAARRSGVRHHTYTFMPFVCCSTIAGIAGLVVLARLGTAQPVLGETLVFDAITAVALAGVLLSGGRGNVFKILVGAIVVATIANGLVLLHASNYWTYISTGVLLILAVWVDRVLSETIERARHEPAPEPSPHATTQDAMTAVGGGSVA
jgi:ribose transport system permease protein